ncbi:MAG: HutP family protein [Synergistetes bacterium]|nr:HutP family protein [Synergistota bacterium]MCX8128331.1 HutP family protein [Synergistota bacterium]MDW8193010.1 HutP family protein [Synergistota bacterium]
MEKREVSKTQDIWFFQNIDVERAAVLLAISRTREEEAFIKELLSNLGLKACVFEIGGINDELRPKLGIQTVTTCLKHGVIRQVKSDVHAVIHAVLEAERGLLMDAPLSSSLLLKVSVVSNGKWLAVCMFGESAFHVLTNHRRIGLGVMHLGD